MPIVNVGNRKYINTDRITYVKPERKGRLTVHFAVGGGDITGPNCCVVLEEDEAKTFEKWLISPDAEK